MPRKKGFKLAEREAIPYDTILECINNAVDTRTKALIAFEYGFGSRVGEFAEEYQHNRGGEKYVTVGVKTANVTITDSFIQLNRPNFKQKKRDALVKGGLISKKFEPELYGVLVKWVDECKKFNREFLFHLRRSRISQLIDKELKFQNPDYSCHWLRHSRASHLAMFRGNPMLVKVILGHSRMDTSMKYVHANPLFYFYGEVDVNKTMKEVLGRSDSNGT